MLKSIAGFFGFLLLLCGFFALIGIAGGVDQDLISLDSGAMYMTIGIAVMAVGAICVGYSMKNDKDVTDVTRI